jgi:hypothetical protein
MAVTVTENELHTGAGVSVGFSLPLNSFPFILPQELQMKLVKNLLYSTY